MCKPLSHGLTSMVLTVSAHKAAHPDENPIRDDVRAMLPSLNGIEERFGPTNVHLQVYDGRHIALQPNRTDPRRMPRLALVFDDQGFTRAIPCHRLIRSICHAHSTGLAVDS